MGSVSVLQGLFGRSGFQLLVLVGLLVVLLVVRLLRTRGHLKLAAVIVGGVLAVALLVVLALTLRPLARPGEVAPRLMLDPVAGAWGWDRIAWRPVLDNVALFVPVGALAAAVLRRRSLPVVWLACVAFSIMVETAQYVIPTGRVANTADVLANAVGALLGVVLGLVARARPAPPARDRRQVIGSVAR